MSNDTPSPVTASAAEGLRKPRKKISRGRPSAADAEIIAGKLLHAALQEFLQHGYGNASLTRIVQAAGASKTTLYSRYPSKEALFQAIIEQQMQYLAPAMVFESSAVPLTLEEGLMAYGCRILKHSLQGDMRGVDRLIYSESHQFPELARSAAERTELGIRRITEFVSICADRESCPCANPRAVAETFIFMIRGWYVNVILTRRSVSDAECERWVTQAVQTLMGGRSAW